MAETRVVVDAAGVRAIASALDTDAAAIGRARARLRFTPGIDAHAGAELDAVAVWCQGAARDLERVAAEAEEADRDRSLLDLARAFIGGLAEGARDTVDGAVDHVAVWRGRGWLATWQADLTAIGDLAGLAVTDPGAFAHLVLDLEGLADDPARWAGRMAVDVGNLGSGAFASARTARLADRAVRIDRRMGHYLAAVADVDLHTVGELLSRHPRLARFSVMRRTDGTVAAITHLPRPVRDGDLFADEGRGARRTRGHTLGRHVARSDAQLRARLEVEPTLGAVGTFDSARQAQRVRDDLVARHLRDIDAWIASGDRAPLRITTTFDAAVGRVLTHGLTASVPTRRVAIKLRRAGTGFRVETLYPQPEHTTIRSSR